MNKHFRLLMVIGAVILLIVALDIFLHFDVHPVGASAQWSSGPVLTGASEGNWMPGKYAQQVPEGAEAQRSDC